MSFGAGKHIKGRSDDTTDGRAVEPSPRVRGIWFVWQESTRLQEGMGGEELWNAVTC